MLLLVSDHLKATCTTWYSKSLLHCIVQKLIKIYSCSTQMQKKNKLKPQLLEFIDVKSVNMKGQQFENTASAIP